MNSDPIPEDKFIDMRGFLIFFRLIRESFLFAMHELAMNKTRTILTLSGITIGIFSIISIYTVFDSMERNIRKGIESLGDNVLFIQKWPWRMGDGSDYPWWKYMKRPEPSPDDLKYIERRSSAAEASTFFVNTSRTVKYRNNSIESVAVMAVSQDYDRVMPFDLQDGRYFTPTESLSGRPVTVIGADIAENLFQGLDPIGRKIKVFGRKLQVIGVMKKEGEDFFGNTSDDQIIVPINFARNVLDIRNMGSTILVRAKDGISNARLKDELTGILRSIHKLKPSAENDFAINETDIISQGFDELFRVIAIVGFVISAFSLLVGGFGIANIMFVSVRERVTIIGIQKSLGAKRYFILFQFLVESVFLALIGGTLGILLVYIVTLFGEKAFGMELFLTAGNILVGVLVSSLIGLLSGIIPAYNASRLDPVDAIRANQ